MIDRSCRPWRGWPTESSPWVARPTDHASKKCGNRKCEDDCTIAPHGPSFARPLLLRSYVVAMALFSGVASSSVGREPFSRNAFLRKPDVIGFFLRSCQFLRNERMRPRNQRSSCLTCLFSPVATPLQCVVMSCHVAMSCEMNRAERTT